MVVRSSFPDVVIPDVTLSEYLLSAFKQYGEQVAIIDSGNNDKTYTYREVHDNAVACAKSFAKLGVKEGDVVALCCGNCAQFAFASIGAIVCGATVTTCNPLYTEVEMTIQFKKSSPKIIFINADQSNKMKKVASQVTSIKSLISMDEAGSCITFSDFLLQGRSQALPNVKNMDRNNTAYILFSSGTTGLPKGVMLSHKNLVSILTMLRVTSRRSRMDVDYIVMPMFHVSGMLGALANLGQGSTIVIKNRFDIHQLLKDIEKYKLTLFGAAPPILVVLDQLPDIQNYDTSSLRMILCGAAPLAENIAKSVAKKFNVQLGQVWGQTEGLPGTASVVANDPIASVGVVPPNTLAKVVDPDSGKELGPNKRGEIWIKGPQVMKGYYQNPAATAQCLDADGWLHTGDIGYYNEKEYFFIVDRLKELIKYKGFQVAPAELEDALLGHPQIVDAGVIGVPDLLAGELPKAFVVRKNTTLSAQQIHEFLKGKVTKYKYLTGGITFVEDIPKSPSGKILRKDLRKMEKNLNSRL